MTMMKTRSTRLRHVPLTALSASLVLLAGCNPVGGGTGPTRLVINGPNGAADAATGDAFVCIRSGLTATLFFEDGSAADFTQRVTWASANPTNLRVSNFNTDPLPPPATAGFLPPGILTPGAATAGNETVRITATFSGLTDTIDMRVGAAPNFQLMQRNIGTGLNQALPVAPPSADPTITHAFRMGPSTTTDLTVLATLGGIPTRVDAAVIWSFDAAPAGASPTNDATAAINSDGVITTLAANTRPLIARATFTPCNQSVAAQVTVAPFVGLSLVPEYGGQRLIAPNTERYFVLADFGSGPEQDISPTTALASSNGAVGTFISALIGIPNLLSSVAAGGPFTVTVTLPTVTGQAEADRASIQQTVVADTLLSIALEPATISAVAGSGTVCPMRLVGTFASGARQDITRRATYASDNITVAVVSSQPQTAGLIGTGGIIPGTATITATVLNGSATAFTATAAYTSTAPVPGTEPALCPQTFEPLPIF